ncbi:YbgC/FadM family acyl-CoA thioesterase [Sphingomonas bacterium]|uniref:YbgC/FadM family acyl-CoA thioesterase n=1 Tax=Sphingomonas bacterium TaxID=1895847 RepID=UPI0020C6CBFD|nr:YbgC/FadM family acyl-CoA thioesterase [Sphingomonas bacterium]
MAAESATQALMGSDAGATPAGPAADKGFRRDSRPFNGGRVESDVDQPVTGRFERAEHRYPVRVHFEDTDLSGVAYHATYLRWMERARSDMLRLAGIDQRAAWEAGAGAYAVADLHIRYRAPARLDDPLLVVSRLAAVGPARVVIHQRVSRGAVLLADAEVTAALVAPSGRPRRQPAAWLAVFRALLEERSCIPS